MTPPAVSPNAGLHRNYHHGDLRRALVEATLALVTEAGVEAFTLSQAARRVGVSPAAPYRHFRNRDDLLAAAAADGFRALEASLGATSALDPEVPEERVAELAARYVGFALAGPEQFTLMFAPNLDKTASPGLLEAVAAAQHVLEAAIDRLPNLPVSHTDATTTIWSVAHGFATLAVAGLLDDRVAARTGAPVSARAAVRTWLAGLAAPT